MKTVHQFAYFRGRKPADKIMEIVLYPAIEIQTRSLTPSLPMCSDFSKNRKALSVLNVYVFPIAVHPID